MSGAVVIGLVALLAAIAGVALILRATPSEASVYRHRIAATMLIAFAAAMATYAWALASWGPGK